ALLIFVGGATVLFYPRVQQQLHTRYAQSIIDDWRESLPESAEFIVQRWEAQSEALWEAVADLPIATNGNVYVAESGHIFLDHAEDIAFGASATPALDYNGYLTLGGMPVADNGVITIGNLSVSHNGSLNISTHGSASVANLVLSESGGLYIGNYNITQIAMAGINYEDFDLNFIFNFDPITDDPMHWLYTEMVDYNHELYEDNQAGLVSLESTEEVDFSVVENAGFSDEMLGYITIESINVSLPIFAGSSHGHMLRGAAHLTQSSLPVGGINTNAVITAHRGLSRARMFRNIDDLRIGDEIRITNFYETLIYRVISPINIIDPTLVYSVSEHNFVIHPDDINSVKIVPGLDLITLFSCEPYRINTHRILVIAERCLDS
ncbi:MAG: class C sortase, partial [Defluviitaleaceae bacterium]|nr:class C sortase [Defluviitaleaceae bacterium]